MSVSSASHPSLSANLTSPPTLARIREWARRKLSPRRRLACILTGCFFLGTVLAQLAVG